mgnify:FL=1
MRVVLQRAKNASVTVDGEIVGKINKGVVLLVGITHNDGEEDAAYLAKKIAHLRIFEDENGKLNHSLLETSREVLSVSQFTLYGDCSKGRRPSFTEAAHPEKAQQLYERFNDRLRELGLVVETGQFGATMDVALTNDGPVTFILESKRR